MQTKNSVTIIGVYPIKMRFGYGSYTHFNLGIKLILIPKTHIYWVHSYGDDPMNILSKMH